MYNPTILALLLTIGILLILTAIALLHREKRGAEIFAILQSVSAVWASLTVLGLTTPTGTARLRLWGSTTALSLVIIVLWFAFILSYTGGNTRFTRRRLGILSLPVIVSATLYLLVPTWTPLVGEVAQETIAAGTVVTASIGPVGAMSGVYAYLIFLLGLGLVVKTLLEGSRLFVGQALALLFGSLITIVASILVVLGIGTEGYPLTQVALGPQAVLWGYAVFGQRLLQVVPAVAEIGERAVFEDLDDGIVVVNGEGIVVRTNPQLKTYLDTDGLVGEPVETLLETIGVDTLGDLPTRFERRRRTYQADVSEIYDWQGEQRGHAVTVRDISQLVTREERLSVLNRILRHNVRNDMNVVLGIGEKLQTLESESLASDGETLSRTARDLNRASEKALEVNRLFEDTTTDHPVALPALVTDVTSRLRDDYPAGTIDTTIDIDSVKTNPQIFEKVLEEVLANALEHAGDEPEIQIEVETTEQDIELIVSDDGPGIPQSELAPIVTGEETQLKHTSSFGLWFIKWGMQKIGGDAEIEATNSGTEVRLRVPDSSETRRKTGSSPTDSVRV